MPSNLLNYRLIKAAGFDAQTIGAVLGGLGGAVEGYNGAEGEDDVDEQGNVIKQEPTNNARLLRGLGHSALGILAGKGLGHFADAYRSQKPVVDDLGKGSVLDDLAKEASALAAGAAKVLPLLAPAARVGGRRAARPLVQVAQNFERPAFNYGANAFSHSGGAGNYLGQTLKPQVAAAAVAKQPMSQEGFQKLLQARREGAQVAAPQTSSLPGKVIRPDAGMMQPGIARGYQQGKGFYNQARTPVTAAPLATASPKAAPRNFMANAPAEQAGDLSDNWKTLSNTYAGRAADTTPTNWGQMSKYLGGAVATGAGVGSLGGMYSNYMNNPEAYQPSMVASSPFDNPQVQTNQWGNEPPRGPGGMMLATN